MARSVVGYIRQFLNSSATASPTQSVEATTGLPIATGTNAGEFQEFSDAEALTYSSRGLVGAPILTAGSGQTPGVYNVTSSTGNAVIAVTVAAGGTVTAVPTIVTAGKFATDTAPTFTLTGTGGTPATFGAVVGFLYSGVYRFAQLDPAVTGGPIAVGTPLFWLQSNAGLIVTTVVSGNYPDLAGWTIDPNHGPALPYAFIQCVGKGKLLFPSANFPATYGDTVNIVAAGTSFTSTAGQTTSTPLTVGYALAVGSTFMPSLCRVYRYISRF